MTQDNADQTIVDLPKAEAVLDWSEFEDEPPTVRGGDPLDFEVTYQGESYDDCPLPRPLRADDDSHAAETYGQPLAIKLASGPREDINSLVYESYCRSYHKGFYDGTTNDAQHLIAKLALVHSEVSEAVEDVRAGRNERSLDENGKPHGLPTELADIVIRVFDLAGYLGIDLATEIRLKSNYNETRPYKHGGKKL